MANGLTYSFTDLGYHDKMRPKQENAAGTGIAQTHSYEGDKDNNQANCIKSIKHHSQNICSIYQWAVRIIICVCCASSGVGDCCCCSRYVGLSDSLQVLRIGCWGRSGCVDQSLKILYHNTDDISISTPFQTTITTSQSRNYMLYYAIQC